MESRWTVEATKLFISQYEINETLYNVHHRDYKDRNKRLQIFKNIVKFLQKKGHCFTTEDLKKKLNGLRTQFLSEKHKISNSIQNGAKGDDIYKPTVYWYSLLHFLDKFTKPNESLSNLDQQTPLSTIKKSPEQVKYTEETPKKVLSRDFHNFIPNEMTPLNKNCRKKRHHSSSNKRTSSDYDCSTLQRSKPSTEINQVVKRNVVTKTNHPKPMSDPVDTFVKFVANELKDIRDAGNEAIMRKAKRQIQEAILQSWDIIITYPAQTASSNSSISSLEWSPVCPRRNPCDPLSLS